MIPFHVFIMLLIGTFNFARQVTNLNVGLIGCHLQSAVTVFSYTHVYKSNT